MKIRGALIASAALGLLAAGPVMADSHAKEESKVKCQGINGCAGKGECGAADGSHDCGGKNSCKGKGWVYKADAKACTDEDGTVQE
jgi:hypothetical protein